MLGRIFAMLVRGCLVLNLPGSRCIDLSAGGSATPFERGQGRPLREWLVERHLGRVVASARG